MHSTLQGSLLRRGGYKGMGEGGTIGAPAAIANAVAGAVRPLGIEVTALPSFPEALCEYSWAMSSVEFDPDTGRITVRATRALASCERWGRRRPRRSDRRPPALAARRTKRLADSTMPRLAAAMPRRRVGGGDVHHVVAEERQRVGEREPGGEDVAAAARRPMLHGDREAGKRLARVPRRRCRFKYHDSASTAHAMIAMAHAR